MNHKEMTEIILNAKAEYILSQRKNGASFSEIGKKLNPAVNRQTTWKILNSYFKKLGK